MNAITFSIIITAYAMSALYGDPVVGPGDELPHEEIVELLSGESVSLRDWAEAQAILDTLPHAKREAALRKIVDIGEVSTAASCATMLIYEGFGDIEDLLIDSIKERPETYASIVLGAINNSNRSEELRQVPRAVMQRLMIHGMAETDGDAPMTIVDMAANILAKSDDPKDLELLREAVQEFPNSPRLWIRLTEREVIGPAERLQALLVYHDEDSPHLSRVAAAAALSSVNESARIFVKFELDSFMNKFKLMTMRDLIGAATSNDEQKISMYREFSEKSKMLIVLRILESSVAQQITATGITSANETIRVTCALVAAERWPQQILDADMTKFRDVEYENLLAFVVQQHPERLTEVQELLSDETLNRAQQRLGEGEIEMVFPFAGRFFTGQ